MVEEYNQQSADSILNHAKKLVGKSLSVFDITHSGDIGKGYFGQLLESKYFGLTINSLAEPDFRNQSIELKSTPLKKLTRQDRLVAKERLVLGIINYNEIIAEKYQYSSFIKKNAHLLIIFYLSNRNVKIVDYIIKCVSYWKVDDYDVDFKIIKDDWLLIKRYVVDGNAHLLSEGLTNYLGACTKGSTAAKSLREQPKSNVKAKQRAFSLKQGYVNHIIYNSCNTSESSKFGRVIKSKATLASLTFDEYVIKQLSKFVNKTTIEIARNLKFTKSKAKSRHALMASAMLGLRDNLVAEEFSKADINVRTINLEQSGILKESISLPAFGFNELLREPWDKSSLHNFTSKKLLIMIFMKSSDGSTFKKAHFHTFTEADMKEAYVTWQRTRKILKEGRVVNRLTKTGKRMTNFGEASSAVSHVRPHAKNRDDTNALPTRDKVTGLSEYTKQSFWINSSYIQSILPSLT